ncbi:MAG: MATE family efflux transporter [Sneathiella sp.]
MSSQTLDKNINTHSAQIAAVTEGPIFSTLIRLSAPNMLILVASVLGAIVELAYVGNMGTVTLASIAVVFPIIVLQQSFSNGAMGGGVSSAISRALGAGNEARAQEIAVHSLIIGVLAGVLFTVLMLSFAQPLFHLLGARGQVMEEALAYSNIVFIGSAAVWLTSMLMSILRGCGNMKIPSQTLFAILTFQAGLGGILGFGVGSLSGLGIVGIGLGQVIAYTVGVAFLAWYLQVGKSRFSLKFSGITLQKNIFVEILRVGLMTCISPLQTILTVLVTTRFISKFGDNALAGYGIGARLEMVLIPIAFGIGAACVPMVGMAIGAGNVHRAKRSAAYGGMLAFAVVGTIGLIVMVAPHLWANLFSTDLDVLMVANDYLIWSGPAYAFFGLGLCLLFASQGAQKVHGPVLAGTVRLIIVSAGCWILAQFEATPMHFFMLVAAGMTIYGLFAAISVYMTNWNPAGNI